MRFASRRTLALAALLVSAAACSRSDDSSARFVEEERDVAAVTSPRPATRAPPPQMTAMSERNEPTPAENEQGTEGQGGRTDAALSLNDDQILAVLSAIEERDIELAKLAAARSKSQLVQNYAAMVIAHRKSAMSTRQGFVDSASMTPSPSETSLAKTEDMQADFDALKRKSGKGFDMAYVEAAIENERDALTFIDDQALASVSSLPLKLLVQSARTAIQNDFTATQDLKRMLEQGPVQQPKKPTPPGV